ncbi:MAG TPA: hypothetical protein VGH33_23110, partial [Isosphaeraceae bacterium]
MATRSKGRGLAYLRRSTGRQELSLLNQLEWAIERAVHHGVALDASPADLGRMMAGQVTSFKGL